MKWHHAWKEIDRRARSCCAVRNLQRSFLLTGVVVLSFLLTGTGLAEEASPDAAQVQGPPSPYEPLPSDKPSAGANESSTVFKPIRNWWNDAHSWETGAGRSYVLPVGEILLYQFLLNLFDRNFVEPTSDYDTDWDTIWDHITDPHWVVDNDQFQVNQFLHPYGGSIYYGLARSTGLNFWESFLYSVAGSYVWELAGETTNPSINDMVATPVGGTFLGEPFFRMASLIARGRRRKARLLARTRRSGHRTTIGIQSPGLRQQVRRDIPKPQACHLHALAGGRNPLIEQPQRLIRGRRERRRGRLHLHLRSPRQARLHVQTPVRLFRLSCQGCHSELLGKREQPGTSCGYDLRAR